MAVPTKTMEELVYPPFDPTNAVLSLIAQTTLTQAAITAILIESPENVRAEFARAMHATLDMEKLETDGLKQLMTSGAEAWLRRVMPDLPELAAGGARSPHYKPG